MKILKINIFILLIGIISNVNAQVIADIEVELSKLNSGSIIPFNIALDKYTYRSGQALKLIKMGNEDQIQVPFQIENGNARQLHWLLDFDESNLGKHSYRLIEDSTPTQFGSIKTNTEDGTIIFQKNERKLLSYQIKMQYPPTGIDSLYKRNAFIHPLWSPHGQVLTHIQPKDHYHHYGIWNPWTHVSFEADTVDFWNLAKHEGTVRFGDLISVIEGPIFSEFKALHKHIVFKENNVEKVALNELQTVRIYNTNDPDSYLVDLIIELNCASKSPVKLLEYRYGGLGWRSTEKWNKDNSEVLTSEGRTRKDADGSLARWCIMQGEVDDDYAGVIMMSYPTNYNHPEPLRIWPETQSGNGDLFANFSPTKNMDWELFPGQPYFLKYRLLVFNGRMTEEKAESAWQIFANNIKIKIEE